MNTKVTLIKYKTEKSIQLLFNLIMLEGRWVRALFIVVIIPRMSFVLFIVTTVERETTSDAKFERIWNNFDKEIHYYTKRIKEKKIRKVFY